MKTRKILSHDYPGKMALVIVMSLFVFVNVNAKNNLKVPVKVQKAFSEKFKNVSDVEWGKEERANWEAEFKMDGKNYSANFDQDGNWLETEYKITKAQIPVVVMSALNNGYPDAGFIRVEVSETPKGTVYEILIKRGLKKEEVCFSPQGHLIVSE